MKSKVFLIIFVFSSFSYGWTPLRYYEAVWPRRVMPVPFELNERGSVDLGVAETERIVKAAFKVWEDVSCSYLTFRYVGLVPRLRTLPADGHNLIIWRDDHWPEEFPPGAIAAALTMTYAYGEIYDSDIQMNGVHFKWILSVDEGSDPSGRFRMHTHSILVHEIGHMLGLGHAFRPDGSVIREATMCPYHTGPEQSSLHPDDIEGICSLYPVPEGRCDGDQSRCPEGWVCVGIGCLKGGKKVCTPCEAHSECGGINDYCLIFQNRRRYCTRACGPGGACGPGERCYNIGGGIPPQCAPINLDCSDRCTTSDDCLTHQRCWEGRCIDLGNIGEPCTKDEDCLRGICKENKCTIFCDRMRPSKECPIGFYCHSSGVCKKGRPGPKKLGETCTQDTDCLSLHCTKLENRSICSEPCRPYGYDTCPPNYICKSIKEYQGSCVPGGKRGIVGSKCLKDEDCETNLCVQNKCSNYCDWEERCLKGWSCKGIRNERRICVPGPPPPYEPPYEKDARPEEPKEEITPAKGCECNLTSSSNKSSYLFLFLSIFFLVFINLRKTFLFFILLFFLGCGQPQSPKNRVQPNIVKKELFSDSWYYLKTVIDVNYEGSPMTYPGDTAYDLSGTFTLSKIRWVIEEDFLYAFRDYEIIERKDKDKDKLNEPVLAFKIEKHLDIKESYNPMTKEKRNIIEENTFDKKWYERKYMRVDWSKNYITGYLLTSQDLYELFGRAKREPISLIVHEGSNLPEEWLPRFEFASPEKKDTWARDYEEGSLYFMSFVTQEVFSPKTVTDPITKRKVPWCKSTLSRIPSCSSNIVTFRHSFLRVPKREYTPLNYVDTRFDKFGYFRLEGQTYTKDYGKTDFLNYNINRYNIFKKHLSSDQSPLLPKVQVHQGIRPIVFYLTPNFPRHLIRPAFKAVAEWNEVFMEMIRELKEEALPKEPYNPFKIPEKAKDDYNCWISGPPEPTKPRKEIDFKDEINLKFEGDECVFILRVNSCDQDKNAPCELLGDIRYNFIHYIDLPGIPFLGKASLRADPETGEMITCTASIAGSLLSRYRTFALQQLDIELGKTTEMDILTGENIRTYFENLGRVERPAIPVKDLIPKQDLFQYMNTAMKRAELLQGPSGKANLFQDKIRLLKDSPFERMLFKNDEMLISYGLSQKIPEIEAESILDKTSPFRMPLKKLIKQEYDLTQKLLKRNFELQDPFIDYSVQRFAERYKKLHPAELAFLVERLLFSSILIHELGHCLGLRHNFAASVDISNFDPEYFKILDKYPSLGWRRGEVCAEKYRDYPWLYRYEPCKEICDQEPYVRIRDGICDAKEAQKVTEEIAKIHSMREKEGLDEYTASSVMEYLPNWYNRLKGLGKYDRAAIKFGYSQLLEVYNNKAKIPKDKLRRHEVSKLTWTYYHGGETCTKDQDCPYYNPEKLSKGQTIRQRCNKNICSNLLDDLKEISETNPRYLPVEYKFCSDERIFDISWCSVFDEGTSFREIVKNAQEHYDRTYIFRNFRRYRRLFGTQRYSAWLLRFYYNLVKIYQHMFYRYRTEEDYREYKGPLGFYDQYMASVDIFNFFTRILAQTDIGSFRYNKYIRRYTKYHKEAGDVFADFNSYLGLGKYLYSSYQKGLTGIERLEQIGVFLDKLYVLSMLTERDWGLLYAPDGQYYVNFYDLFPYEMTELFAGMIRDVPEIYGPRRLDDTRIIYLDLWRGDCSLYPEKNCRPKVQELYQDLPTIEPGHTMVLRVMAAIFALTRFSVFFDTNFLHRLYIFVQGSGSEVKFPEGWEHATHRSERFQKTFAALKMKDDQEIESIGYEMVKEASELQSTLKAYWNHYDNGTLPPGSGITSQKDLEREIGRLESRFANLEAFLFQLVSLQEQMKISSYIEY